MKLGKRGVNQRCVLFLLALWLASILAAVWAWISAPNLFGCQRAEPTDGPTPEQVRRLREALAAAHREIEMQDLSLEDARAKLNASEARISLMKMDLPLRLDSDHTCAAACLEKNSSDTYCADAPLKIGRVADLAECKEACDLYSACSFSSYFSTGFHRRLCLITATCNDRRTVTEPKDVVRIFERIVKASSKTFFLQQLGMFDSGTNVMTSMLARNLPHCCSFVRRQDLAAVQVPDGMGECLRAVRVSKHANPHDYLAAVQGRHLKFWDPQSWFFRETFKITLIAMIRDPLAQLQSWKKAGYDMEKCAHNQRCLADAEPDCDKSTAWLTQPCSFQGKSGYSGGSDAVGGNFRSLPEVWNSYTDGYLQLELNGGFKGALILKFEDLVLKPEEALGRMARALGMTVPNKEVSIPVRPAKSHGQAMSREEEITSLRSRSFLKKYSAKELAAACTRLNLTLAKHVGYDVSECQNVSSAAAAHPILAAAKSQPVLDIQGQEQLAHWARIHMLRMSSIGGSKAQQSKKR